jgi:hypothetical protein
LWRPFKVQHPKSSATRKVFDTNIFVSWRHQHLGKGISRAENFEETLVRLYFIKW